MVIAKGGIWFWLRGSLMTPVLFVLFSWYTYEYSDYDYYRLWLWLGRVDQNSKVVLENVAYDTQTIKTNLKSFS